MKRAKKKNPKAHIIFTSDIHLEESAPISRTDDYEAAQKRKLAFLCEYVKDNDAEVLDGGDIFNHWKPSPYLIIRALRELPDVIGGFTTVPGNHDLPNHSVSLQGKSGLQVLEDAGKIHILHSGETDRFPSWPIVDIYGFAFGQEVIPPKDKRENPRVLIIHEMIWETSKPPFPGAEGMSAEEAIETYKDFDIILSGHNHNGFMVQQGKRFLINPGSMMRISADKKDYRPRFYAMNLDTWTVWPVYYPIEPNVHDDSHLVEGKERDARQQAFIQRMNLDFDLRLNFKQNLTTYFKKNKTPKRIEEIIWQSME